MLVITTVKHSTTVEAEDVSLQELKYPEKLMKAVFTLRKHLSLPFRIF
jgi:hypothetical protein